MTLYTQQIFDLKLDQFVFYTLTRITPSPQPNETSPNHTNNLIPVTHSILHVGDEEENIVTVSNLPSTGAQVFKQKTGADFQFRRIKSGTNISVVEETNEIVISAAGGGSGDVLGPESSTTNHVVRWGDDTGGSLRDTGVQIDDANNVSGVKDLSANFVEAEDCWISNALSVQGNIVVDGTVDDVDIGNLASLPFVTLGPTPNLTNEQVLTAGTGIDLDVSTSNKVVISTTGSGGVTGPASATINAISRFGDTAGKVIKNTGVLVNDEGDVTGVKDLTVTGDISLGGTIDGADVGQMSTAPVLTASSADGFSGAKVFTPGHGIDTDETDSALTVSTTLRDDSSYLLAYWGSEPPGQYQRVLKAGKNTDIQDGGQGSTLTISSTGDVVGPEMPDWKSVPVWLAGDDPKTLTNTGVRIDESNEVTGVSTLHARYLDVEHDVMCGFVRAHSVTVDPLEGTVDGVRLNDFVKDTQFITFNPSGHTGNERILTEGANISIVDNGPGQSLVISATGGGGGGGTGDVSGPGSSTLDSIPKYIDATGKLIGNSTITISGTNNLLGINDLTMSGNLNATGDVTGLNITRMTQAPYLTTYSDSYNVLTNERVITEGHGIKFDQTTSSLTVSTNLRDDSAYLLVGFSSEPAGQKQRALKQGAGITLTDDGPGGFLTISAIPPSGDVYGDVIGTTATTTVRALQGRFISTQAPTNGQVLGWNGTNWIPTDPPSGGGDATALQGRPLDSAAPSQNQVIAWDGTKWTPQTVSGVGGSSDATSLRGININEWWPPTTNDLLYYDGTSWSWQKPSIGGYGFRGNSPVDGQVLTFVDPGDESGGAWEARDAGGGGGGVTGYTDVFDWSSTEDRTLSPSDNGKFWLFYPSGDSKLFIPTGDFPVGFKLVISSFDYDGSREGQLILEPDPSIFWYGTDNKPGGPSYGAIKKKLERGGVLELVYIGYDGWHVTGPLVDYTEVT